MTAVEPLPGDDPETLAIEERQRRGNRIWLVVLVMLVLGLIGSSYFLMNNYYDPYIASRAGSH